MVAEQGLSVSEVAQDLDVNPNGLRNWGKTGQGKTAEGKVTFHDPCYLARVNEGVGTMVFPSTGLFSCLAGCYTMMPVGLLGALIEDRQDCLERNNCALSSSHRDVAG